MSVGPFGQDPGDMLAGATQCPHCGGVANVLPHDELKQVCGLCGAPRIEVKGDVKLSGGERPGLEKARAAERGRIQWKVGAWFGTATTAFIFSLWLLWALIFSAGAVWAVSGLALAAPFLLLALAGFARSRGKVGEVQEALREAWRSAARDVVAAHPNGITAKQLSEQLPITEAEAEHIAAELSVDNLVSTRVTDDGQLVLQQMGGARIDTSAGQRVAEYVDPLEERFAELEQAEQEAAKRNRAES